MFTSVLSEVHVNLENISDESELVFRYKEMKSRLEEKEQAYHNAQRDFLHIEEEFRQRGIEVVHAEIGDSIRVWLWCRTQVAAAKLQKMEKDGRLRDLLNRMFTSLLKREEKLKAKLYVICHLPTVSLFYSLY